MPINTTLDAVIQWDMTKQEALVYKLALIWEDEVRKLFPDEPHMRLLKRGDPRKSILFRHMWQLARERKNQVKETEWRQYIHGNLAIIKKHGGYIAPTVLLGDAAWIRWRVWSSLYRKAMAEKNGLPPPLMPDFNNKIVQELIITKNFLHEKCDGELTRDRVTGVVKNPMFQFWVASGKISLYYVVNSPVVKENYDMAKLGQLCRFDESLITGKTTSEIKEFFRHEFDYEH